MNDLTDMDWGWWPFLHLRPRREDYIDLRLLFRMCLHYGPIIALAFIGIDLAADDPVSIPTIVGYAIGCPLIFFVMYLISFAYFWNRRADRLRTAASGQSTGGATKIK